jgi:Type VI secretion system VasI, EvfG, VC_A0118
VDAAPSVAASPGDKWHLTESRSSIDDSKNEVLLLDVEAPIQGPLGSTTPSLIVRCKEKKTNVYVNTGMAATVEEGLDGHKVALRLDGNAARYEDWNESTDHKALFADESEYRSDVVYPAGAVVKLAKELARAKTLTFQFTPFDGSPQVMHFDLRGLDSHIDKVAEACGWSTD